MQNDLIAALSSSRLFREMAPEMLRTLACGAVTVSAQAGEHIFHTDEPATAFYLVKEGQVRLYRPNHEGNEKVFQVVSPGDLIAETAMFAEPCRYPLSAQAETAVCLYRVTRTTLLDLTRQSADFAMQLLATMSARIYQAVNRIDHLTIGNASQRLVLHLIDLSREQRSRRIHFPVSGGALARQLNIAPETLSRQLNHFKRTGLLDGRNRDWVLLDVDGLHRSVGLPPPSRKESEAWHDTDLGSDLFGCCNFR
ncbi:MAG: Crp/Fnr family transcriptional regulator [Corticimicrobacter sp.]|uniref:Crp/Fnr family transcriptional regulator n=1 Tax=Corticimicrobacter sp. TaxID=2678536 RepID=UPI0032DAE89B